MLAYVFQRRVKPATIVGRIGVTAPSEDDQILRWAMVDAQKGLVQDLNYTVAGSHVRGIEHLIYTIRESCAVSGIVLSQFQGYRVLIDDHSNTGCDPVGVVQGPLAQYNILRTLRGRKADNPDGVEAC